MFMRLVILESDRHALWIKVAGGFLIALRFADWPYELAFYSLQADIMKQEVLLGATCLTQWGSGVIVLNFVADVLANLFLSGMFVRRLYMHISTSKSLMSQHNRVIEYIARKSLLCLTLTFVVNLTMNLLKVTEFMGDRSDSFTVYFQLIESTLLVEALRVDYTRLPSQAFCENCGMAIRYLRSKGTSDSAKRSKSRTDEQNEAIDLKQVKAPPEAKTSNQFHHPLATFAAQSSSNPFTGAVRETTSAPNFALGSRPLRSGEIPVDATASFSMERPSRLADRPEWSNNDYRMFNAHFPSSTLRHEKAILLAALSQAVKAIDIAVYKVIGSLSKDPEAHMAVHIEDGPEVYVLEKSTLDSLVHVGYAPALKRYHYLQIYKNGTVIDEEMFSRLPSTSPAHDFYASTLPRHTMPKTLPVVFPRTYDRIDSSAAHPTDEIPTLHIIAPGDDLKELYDNYLDSFAINVNMTHISGSELRQFENVKFQLGGQTSRLFEKFSFNIHISKDNPLSLGGYRRFKLRACVTDPTFMREKLYYDVLDAAGLPASRASFVRLFINEEPMGLYGMIDNYKNPFLKNVFGHGKKYKHGVLYQGSMPENPMAPEKLSGGANLAYLGPNPSDYVFGTETLYKISQEASRKDNGLQRLIEFMEFVNNPGLDEEEDLEEAWNKRLDVDLFLKNMAFEVLMGHVDGYLGQAHNYFLYHEPKTEQFLWMTADLDQTMGNSMVPLRNDSSPDILAQLDRFDLLSPNRHRPLVKAVLAVPTFRERFTRILEEIHQALYVRPVLLEHMYSLATFIREDVLWDATVRKYRASAFANDEVAKKHRDQIQQKILQLPLGTDFLSRIGAVDFDKAIEGPIHDHPSLMPLKDWIHQTGEALTRFVSISSAERQKMDAKMQDG
ncbi:hypothetical protein DFQ28_000956 [Apophysomyces sp. BC1034]|nr:hypothetical protein DFQ30_008761 [Apophysomyces sp. BC1015]KAG0183319.1 hypothetical protein DFQ29_006888 [Apophysomyces sp. BC1021]KAG0194237.1 hypothetical protein DFQ28_000956 [Apophysomyces sp. BC1034]